jgi:hypothetical protein
VARLKVAGNATIYSTYLGGSSFNWASGIAADASGNAHVSGYTSSVDFPVTGPVQTTVAGASDAFVSEVASAGNSLIFATLYGGTQADPSNAIALDINGNIFTGDQTSSTDLHTVASYQSVNAGGSTGWLMRLGVSTQVGWAGTAQFVKLDTLTQGSWQGVYGAGGYNEIGIPASYPSCVTAAPIGTQLTSGPPLRLMYAGPGNQYPNRGDLVFRQPVHR